MNPRENSGTTRIGGYVDLVKALYGVAKGPQPRNIKLYKEGLMATYSVLNGDRNPAEDIMTPCLINLTQNYDNTNNTIPWSASSKLYVGRALTSIASFADDHEGSIPREFFPPLELHSKFINDIEQEKNNKGSRIDVLSQYNIALNIANGNPLAAAILCHSVTRRIARDADTVKYGILNLEDRIRFAGMIAYFEDTLSPTIDSLGDTYHFWAKYIAGFLFHELQSQQPVSNYISSVIYQYSPYMMKFIRNYIFHNKLEFDTKKKIDQMGFRVGKNVANACSIRRHKKG